MPAASSLVLVCLPDKKVSSRRARALFVSAFYLLSYDEEALHKCLLSEYMQSAPWIEDALFPQELVHGGWRHGLAGHHPVPSATEYPGALLTDHQLSGALFRATGAES